MGAGYLTNPIAFLINTAFGLYILVVMLRLLLAWVRADFYNPVSQFVVKLTNPLLLPLRRILPAAGPVDTAGVVLLLVLQTLTLLLVTRLSGLSAGLGALTVLAVAELVGLLLNVFIFSILIQAVLSWVNPGTYNPVTSVLHSLNEPLLRPARRVIPPLGGIDLSPLAAIVLLQVIKMLVLPPIRHLAGVM